MKLYEFLMLPEEKQYKSVWELGTHIDNFQVGLVIFQLYAINDFFVEIEYSTAENRILGKSTFKQGEKLDRYLPKI